MDDVAPTSRRPVARSPGPLARQGAMARLSRLSLLLFVLLCTAGVCTASQEVEDEVVDAVEEVGEEATQAAFAHLVFSKVCVTVCCCWCCAPRRVRRGVDTSLAPAPPPPLLHTDCVGLRAGGGVRRDGEAGGVQPQRQVRGLPPVRWPPRVGNTSCPILADLLEEAPACLCTPTTRRCHAPTLASHACRCAALPTAWSSVTWPGRQGH